MLLTSIASPFTFVRFGGGARSGGGRNVRGTQVQLYSSLHGVHGDQGSGTSSGSGRKTSGLGSVARDSPVTSASRMGSRFSSNVVHSPASERGCPCEGF